MPISVLAAEAPLDQRNLPRVLAHQRRLAGPCRERNHGQEGDPSACSAASGRGRRAVQPRGSRWRSHLLCSSLQRGIPLPGPAGCRCPRPDLPLEIHWLLRKVGVRNLQVQLDEIRFAAEPGGKPLFAMNPLFQRVVGSHPSRLGIDPLAVLQTGRHKAGFWSNATRAPFVLLRRRPFCSVLLQRGGLDPMALG